LRLLGLELVKPAYGIRDVTDRAELNNAGVDRL